MLGMGLKTEHALDELCLSVCVFYRPVHIDLSVPDIITNKICFGYSRIVAIVCFLST